MTRRTFLTATAATPATLAGCGGRVPGATPSADERTVDSEPGRHRFDFAHDGEAAARVFVAASEAPVSPATVRATDGREPGLGYEFVGGVAESTLVSTFRVAPRAPTTTLTLRVAVTLRTDDGERVVVRVDETVEVPGVSSATSG